MRTNRPFFEMKYKLIEYTVQRSFNSDVVYCLAYSSLSCQEFSLGIFSHFSQRHRKKTKKHMKSEQRQFDIIFSLLLPIKKVRVSVCVSMAGMLSKAIFFPLDDLPRIHDQNSISNRTLFLLFHQNFTTNCTHAHTRTYTHTTHVIYMLELIHAQNK